MDPTQPPGTHWTPMQLACMRIYAERCRSRRCNSLPADLGALAADGPIPMGDTVFSNGEVSEIIDSRGNLGTGGIDQGDSGLEDYCQPAVALKVIKSEDGKKNLSDDRKLLSRIQNSEHQVESRLDSKTSCRSRESTT